MDLSAAQEKAINTRNCNILVSAGAGSGKTFVLVNRIIDMISSKNVENSDKTVFPVDIDKLAVLTFTDAAAKEMKKRVFDELHKKAGSDPSNLQLKRQLSLLNRANIVTIHSFCFTIVKQYFHKLNLDPKFRLVSKDDAEIEILRTNVLDEMMNRYYSDYYVNGKNEMFIKISQMLGTEIDDRSFRNIILGLYKFSLSLPNPINWLRRCSDEYIVKSLENTKCFGYFLNFVENYLQNILEIIDNCIKLASTMDSQKYIQVLNDDLLKVFRVLEALRYGYDKFYESTNIKWMAARGVGEGPHKDRIKKNRDDYKEKINKLRKEIPYSNCDEIVKNMTLQKEFISYIAEITIEFYNKMQEAKLEKNIVDFNDLEHFCLKILYNGDSFTQNFEFSQEALEIQSKFVEIIIDEYQDVNPIQELILKGVAGYNPRFMVGDVKQAIYGFRHADSKIFLDKYAKYSQKGNIYGKLIILPDNYRSSKNIINCINYIFTNILSQKLGGVDYNSDNALRYGANYDGIEDCSILQIITQKNDDEYIENDESNEINDTLLDIKKADIEAKACALHIKDLFDKQYKVLDKKLNGLRNIRYSDIVILMRNKAESSVFSQALKEMNIPAFYNEGDNLFLQSEVALILAILQIIDNPRQDIELITIMYSSIFRFSPDELLNIRSEFKNILIYEALLRHGEYSDKRLAFKVESMLEAINKWRDIAIDLTISELLIYIYNETDFYNFVLSLPGGKIRQANLDLFFEKAVKYESGSAYSLFGFIRYISHMQKRNFGFEQAHVISENANVVNIMTIHKSKGLEFPVVFVAGLGKSINKKESREKFLQHYDLGFGFNMIDEDKNIVYPSFVRFNILKTLEMEKLSEEMRILYVALTRAKQKLFLIGTIKDMEKSLMNIRISSENNLPSGSYLISNGSFLQWIIAAMCRHKDFTKEFNNNLGNVVDDSVWKVIFSDKLKILEDSQQKISYFNEDNSTNIEKSNQYDEVKRRLDYKYSNLDAIFTPSKMSVTEIKRMFYREYIADNDENFDYGGNKFDDNIFIEPKFVTKNIKITGKSRGIVIHKVLQHLDFSNTEKDDILNLLDLLCKKGLLTVEEVDLVSVSKIQNLLASELALRIRKSTKLIREVSFTIAVKPELLGFSKDLSQELLVHGVIDCVFEEMGKIIIVDFKTGVLKNAPQLEAEKHRIQMAFYREAAQRLYGEVVEVLVYFFDDCSLISI